ncbi:MAG: alpha/beta hydrolase [Planctomycetes bacterium]|nr:alpha/beta hydrolase [Planctomycetota bacterium]
MQLLLVHGLGRTPLSLFGLAAFLRARGHHTRFFGYSSTFENVPRILRRLKRVLRDLAGRGAPIGLVGHSLGGLFLRTALPGVPAVRVHHLVTLGTPAAPSHAARLAWCWLPPFRVFARDCARFLMNPGTFANLGVPACPFTAVAGTSGPRGRFAPFGSELNDGLVSVAEARGTGPEPLTVPALHTVIMDAPAARAAVARAFGLGKL